MLKVLLVWQLDRLSRRTAAWVISRFDPGVLWSREERAMRVLEEALELAQASGVRLDKVVRLAGVVYEKPMGAVDQEVAGVGVCLLAYCASQHIRLGQVILAELARIEGLSVEYFRKRHAIKTAAGVALAPMEDGDGGV